MRRISFLAVAALLVAGTALANEEVCHSFTASAARGHVQRVVIDMPAGEFRIRNGAADRISVSGTSTRHFEGFRRRAKGQRIPDDISAGAGVTGDQTLVRCP